MLHVFKSRILSKQFCGHLDSNEFFTKTRFCFSIFLKKKTSQNCNKHTFWMPPYLLCVCILLSVSNYCGWERRFCIPKTQLVQLYGLWSKSHCCTPCHRQRLLSFREGGSSIRFFKFLIKIQQFDFKGLQVINWTWNEILEYIWIMKIPYFLI